MKKYILSVVFSIMFLYTSAQVAGYMGKRFLIEFRPSVAVNAYWEIVNKNSSNTRLQVSPHIIAEYAITRNGSLLLDYQYAKHNTNIATPITKNTLVGPGNYNVMIEQTPVVVQSIGINYRNYGILRWSGISAWGLAPFGAFVGVGVSNYYGLKAPKKESKIDYQSPKIKGKMNYTLEVGARNILFHRITVSYSFSYRVSFTKAEGVRWENRYWGTLDKINEYNASQMINIIPPANRFTANIGLGCLIF